MKNQDLKRLSETMTAHSKLLAASGHNDFARHFAELADLIKAANEEKRPIH